jgi:hypothetical protein
MASTAKDAPQTATYDVECVKEYGQPTRDGRGHARPAPVLKGCGLKWSYTGEAPPPDWTHQACGGVLRVSKR